MARDRDVEAGVGFAEDKVSCGASRYARCPSVKSFGHPRLAIYGRLQLSRLAPSINWASPNKSMLKTSSSPHCDPSSMSPIGTSMLLS